MRNLQEGTNSGIEQNRNAGTLGSPLDPNIILAAEFEYISQTAFQANEDRARVTNFYLVTLAGFIAAILGTQFERLAVPQVYYAFSALFVVLGAASVLTILQLARLRQAWFSSVSAMNQVKAYYVSHCTHLQLTDALVWDINTLPARFKPWSLGFLVALQTAILGGASVAAATVFVGLIRNQWWWWQAAAAAFLFIALQLWLYRHLLRGDDFKDDGEHSRQAR